MSNGLPGTAASLPWHLIPPFKPGETDLSDYGKRLQFLSGIWPQEHLGQLAPRAALLCEGSAFQKILRIPPEKLKVGDTSGIQLLVTTLGGVWERLPWRIDTRSLRRRSLVCRSGATKPMKATLQGTRLSSRTWSRRTCPFRTSVLTCFSETHHCSVKTRKG